MIHGYARVSTHEQNDDMQRQALDQAGAQRIWAEHASGAITTRPVLDELLEAIQPGDTLMVYRLDRLGRSLSHLVTVIEDLRRRGIVFRSLHENIDAESAIGRFQLQIFAALAEFERSLLIERTLDGMATARAAGRHLGRPTVRTPERIAAAHVLRDQDLTVDQIAATLGISPASVYRIFAD